jgi:long-chain acyl-CoA synthetase
MCQHLGMAGGNSTKFRYARCRCGRRQDFESRNVVAISLSATIIQGVRAHLASLVDEFLQHRSETAVVAHRGNRRYPTTYGELAEIAGRFSAELHRRGLAPGDRIVLWGENSAEWIGVFFGCLLRGVVVVPLDAAGTSEFAGRVIQDVAPKLIVGDRDLLSSLPQQASASESSAAPEIPTQPIPRLALAELNRRLPLEPLFTIDDAVTAQTPFQIVFTSGTTSEPRGIVHTHRNVLVTLQPIENEMAKYRRYERFVHPLRFLHSLPLSHVFGQFMGLWIPALLAAEVHFAEQLEPSRLTDLIRRERISVLVAVPRILHLLRAHLLVRFPTLATELDRAAGLSIWKRWWHFRRIHSALGWKFWAVISGGATLPPELEAFWNRLGFALIQGYGMTETAALVTLNHPFHIKQGTIGKPLPGREVKITEEGEILVRGDMLAGATWQGGKMRQREGEWLATGDLAEKNASGDLRFLGRKGDVIVTGAGMNIHPADLEEAMAAQPGVRACVVVACDFAGGAEPVAVVLFSGSEQELQAAVAQANRGLAEFQQIRRVLRWPELQFPYTSSGKLIRRQVAQWACNTLLGQQTGASGTAPRTDVLLELIAEVTGEPVSAPVSDWGDTNGLRLSEDLHLDSLGRVQLQSLLEQRLGIELEDDQLAALATVGDLRTLLERDIAPMATEKANSTQQVSDEPQVTIGSRQSATDEPQSYPNWPWIWPVRTVRILFIELIMRPLVWLLAAPRVARLTTNLPDGPLLLIANHVTAYDGALILYALPAKLRRRVAAAMSGEMLLDLRHGRNQSNALVNLLAPAGYWLLTALFNVFPLPRARGFRRSFAHAGEAMDRGYSVLIFPEGTRSRDGKLHPFRPGIGLLAQESRVPILPIALIGLGELRATQTSGHGARWFRSGKLEIRIGQPIPMANDLTDPAHLTATFETAVRDLQTST